MEIVKGNFGECHFIDCFKELPTLQDQQFDLCLTDPPYNIAYNPHHQENRKTDKIHACGKAHKYEVNYQDEIADYPKFCTEFYQQAIRTCKQLIFTPGNQNLGWWLNTYPPTDWGFHYRRNGKGCTHIFQFCKKEVVLFYGKYPPFCFIEDVWDIYLNNGFLDKDHFVHTSPKSVNLYRMFIECTEPKAVIDPFLGSGTTAEVCEEKGIPWLGFELKIEYKQDIERRIKTGIQKYRVSHVKRLSRYAI